MFLYQRVRKRPWPCVRGAGGFLSCSPKWKKTRPLPLFVPIGAAIWLAHGFGWVVKGAHVHFKRPLGLGDAMIVRTWIDDIVRDGVRVQFQIMRKATGKLCADGFCDYTLIGLETGRAAAVPDWIRAKYAV